MDTQIVYVVVSDSTDCYLEQAMLSLHSLRVHTPSARVILITDCATDRTLEGHRCDILKYISVKKVIHIPDGYSKVQRSRYLKTTVRRHVSGDYLFVDTDTIVMRDLADADALQCDIGAVRDMHLPYSRNPGRGKFNSYLSLLGMTQAKTGNRYFNSGIILVHDTPSAHRLYDEWHKAWKVCVGHGINFDQPALAKANHMCGNIIRELPGLWNCQMSTPYGRSFHDDAYILHYFGGKNNIPALPCMPPELRGIILPASATAASGLSIPVTDSERELLHTRVAAIFQNHRRVFCILEWISTMLLKIKGEPLN